MIFLECLLQPDPYSRPMIIDIIERLETIAVVLGVRPTDPVTGLHPTEERSASPSNARRSPQNAAQPPIPSQPQVTSSRPQPPRPPPPRTTSIQQSDEDRIRAHAEKESKLAAEEHKRAMAEEEEYRQRLANENKALKEARNDAKNREFLKCYIN